MNRNGYLVLGVQKSRLGWGRPEVGGPEVNVWCVVLLKRGEQRIPGAVVGRQVRIVCPGVLQAHHLVEGWYPELNLMYSTSGLNYYKLGKGGNCMDVGPPPRGRSPPG